MVPITRSPFWFIKQVKKKRKKERKVVVTHRIERKVEKPVWGKKQTEKDTAIKVILEAVAAGFHL